jgi:hypothetical protein
MLCVPARTLTASQMQPSCVLVAVLAHGQSIRRGTALATTTAERSTGKREVQEAVLLQLSGHPCIPLISMHRLLVAMRGACRARSPWRVG